MRRLILGLIVCLAAVAVQCQTSISFCDLIRTPEKYAGKLVKVRATYKYGFEWQQLYCLDCLDKGKTWLDLSGGIDERSEKSLKLAPKGAGIVNLTVQASSSAVKPTAT
jgi:hypothetical protein